MKRLRFGHAAAVACAGLAAVSHPGFAATITWTSPHAEARSWHDTRFWDLGRTPRAADEVVIGLGAGPLALRDANARVFSIDGSVLLGSQLVIDGRRLTLGSEARGSRSSIGKLSLQGGTLGLLRGSSLQVESLLWSGGLIDGYANATVEVRNVVDSPSRITGSANKRLRAATPLAGTRDITLTFTRAVEWTGTGNLILADGAVLEIGRDEGHLVDFGGHRINRDGSIANTSLVRNLGIYELVRGRTVSEVVFRNPGTIRIADGTTLNLAGGLFFDAGNPDRSTYDSRAAFQTLLQGTYDITGSGQLGVALGTNDERVRNGIVINAAEIVLRDVGRDAVPIRNLTDNGTGTRDALSKLRRNEGTLRLVGTTHLRLPASLENSGRIAIESGAKLSLRGGETLESGGPGLIDVNEGTLDAGRVTVRGPDARLRLGTGGRVIASQVDLLGGATGRSRGEIKGRVVVDGVDGENPAVRTVLTLENNAVVDGDVRVRRAGELLLRDAEIKGDVDLIGRARFEGLGTIGGNFEARVQGNRRPEVVVGVDTRSEGRLDVAGNFRSEGVLELSITGNQQGTTYDFISVAGTGFIDGILDVRFGPGFTPQLGQQFDVFRSVGLLEGTFDQITVSAGLPDGMRLVADYSQHDVFLYLTQAAPIPEPRAALLLLTGLALVAFRATGSARRAARAVPPSCPQPGA